MTSSLESADDVQSIASNVANISLLISRFIVLPQLLISAYLTSATAQLGSVHTFIELFMFAFVRTEASQGSFILTNCL